MQGVLVFRPQRQRGLVGIDGTFVVTALVAAVSQVIECIRFDIFTLNRFKGLTGIGVTPGTVERNTAPVGVREIFRGLAVVTLMVFLCRILFRVSEPGRIGNRHVHG